jgi:hypothetical protein
MEKQPDGFWTITTPPLVPGLHYYTLIIDGAEVSDTSSPAFFGGSKYASAVEVPEPGSTWRGSRAAPFHRTILDFVGPRYGTKRESTEEPRRTVSRPRLHTGGNAAISFV